MKKTFKNAVIWFVAALVITMLTEVFVTAFEAELGEHSGLLIFAVAFYAAWFALTGTVVQGAFIKMHYYQMGAVSSIFVVGTLTLIIVVMLQLTFSGLDLWIMVKLMSIPNYTVTAISYFSTRDK